MMKGALRVLTWVLLVVLVSSWRVNRLHPVSDVISTGKKRLPPLQSTPVNNVSIQPIWSNPSFSADQLKEFWNQNDPLMTVGAAGTTNSLLNSLNDLADHHNVVKVKFASDKINALETSEKFLSDERISKKVCLLEVRQRGFLVRRLQLLPPPPPKKPRPERTDRFSSL